ncbi:MAG: hypothetical protein QNJ12_02930 [Ilumatobacter sp.]|uniref:hypothetical protein n=1 Tax=Ilumatobacter sp. TaxID=1967498 RepID=UPI002632F77C|nr:hypothetical protein [Ilumatobacter sp.]MDJ0767713.1 hypothetical protein [Ilumatobacter sp.]
MSVRTWIERVLGGGAEDADPDEFVEFAVVRITEGPMLVARLQQAGIDAIGDEAFSYVTDSTSQYRVMVRRRDVDTAARVRA